jgi:hypothetical protein
MEIKMDDYISGFYVDWWGSGGYDLTPALDFYHKDQWLDSGDGYAGYTSGDGGSLFAKDFRWRD